LLEAYTNRASDIHIEPLENKLRIRFRIDGVLQEMQAPPKR
jgi:type II secretory ATPase GspE/PulE/Tfp pilus assembly ATPase PilB-like protein